MLGALGGALLSGGAKLASGILGSLSGKQLETDMKRKARLAEAQSNRYKEQYNADLDRRIAAAMALPDDVRTVRDESGFDTTAESQWQQSGVDMAGLMKAARENGFNPITFLRNGGLQAFSNSQGGSYSDRRYGSHIDETVSGSARQMAMTAALSPRQLLQSTSEYVSGNVVPAPSMGAAFGDALTAGVDTYLNMTTQLQQNEIQKALVQQQLAGINANKGSILSRSFNVPSGFQSGGTTTAGNSAALHGNVQPYKNPGDILMLGGIPIKTDGSTSSAEDCETRYGDIAQEFCGWGVFLRDMGVNAKESGHPITAKPESMPWSAKGATLGDIGNALSKYFAPWYSEGVGPGGTTW